MATQIGFISAIIGTATATTPDGSSRQLQAGDKVYQNELITTGSGGAIEIQFNDGSVMDLGRQSQAMLDTGVFNPAMPATAAAENVDDDVEAIQQALLEGEDPTIAGEATAAGPGAGVGDSEGGSSFVARDYLNPEVIPTSGFDTIGVSSEFEQPEELNLIVVDEGIVDGTPSTDITIGLVDEDDLGVDFQLAFVGPSAIISTFESDTGLNAQFPFVFGNNDEAGGDDLPPDSSPSQTGTLNASFGSDGAGAIMFNPAATQPAGLTSGGEPVQFWVSTDGGMLVGYIITDSENAEVIFTVELDPLSLDYAFTLHGPLDHADDSTEDNFLINLSYEISDSDGDSADGILQINVDDDSPLVTLTLNSDQQSELPLSIVVDESVGTDGSTKDEPGFADNDDETVSADETDIGYATISGGDLFNVDVDAGADGENFSARSFALSLALPTGEIEVDSGLDATNGGDIMLSLDGDDIVGMDAETIVFRISIDGDTGDVAVSQYTAIDHGDDDNNHDSLLSIGEGLIGANVTVYDNDGDSTTSDDVELASLIGFEDDGPMQTVTVNAGAAAALAIELDETEGVDRSNSAIDEVVDGNTDDAGPGLAQVTTAVAGGLTTLFTVSGSYGSDGAGTVNGALSFTGVSAEGLNTSLSATDGGAITLHLEDGELVGRDGGDEIVFTVAIVESPADSGEYQLQTTLFEAIDHGDDGNLYDSVTQLLLSGEGEVQLQYAVTRTDGDGDEVVASDQVTLIDAETSVFSFDDDGPTQTVTVNAGAADVLAVELDETEGNDRANASLGEVADGNIDDAGPGLAQVTTSVTGGLTTLFTVSGSYGSDGAGTVNSALSFTGVPAEGLNTSLSATDGGAITLYLENDELVGRDGDNHIVFTMAIVESPAESGEYQLQTTLLEAIEHVDDGNFYDSVTQLLLSGEGEVQLQYAVTRTDGDGDEAVASDQVTLIDAETSVFSFDDDGPEVTMTIAQEAGQIIVDESLGTDGSTKDEPGLADNDDETDSVDVTDIGYATISGSNLFNLSVSPGSDGEDVDARSFALTLALPDNETEVASGLEATDGGAVMLSWETEGSVIVGTDDDGDVVFRISMDADTGNVTLSQYEAINHGDDDNDHDALLTIDSGLIGATVTVFDNDGDSATSEDIELGSLIGFEDDGPKAEDDGVINVAEDTPISFDVFGNDEFGSDGVATDNAPSIVVTHSGASNGTVSYDAQTGQFTYTPNAGYAGSDSFTYTLEDGDGDTSTATVSLLVAADSTPQVGETDNLTVDEDGFDFAANDDETSRDDETDSSESLTDSGTVTVNFGNDVPVNLLSSIVLVDEVGLDSQLTSGGEPVVFALELGALVGRADGTEVIRIEITSAVAGGNTGEVDYSYQVTLSQPVEHVAGALENSELLSGVKFTVTDSDNSTADGTFNVSIVDDVPAAEDDTDTLSQNDNDVTGNVVTDSDVFGADGPIATNAGVTAVRTGAEADSGTPGTIGSALAGDYGTLTLNADGSYTYTLTADVDYLDNGESETDEFTYTITDGDNDTDQATLTITITGTNDVPELQVDADNKLVNEKGLSIGSGELVDGNAANDSDTSEQVTGSFTFSDAEGLADIASLTISGTTLTLGQSGINSFDDMVGQAFNTDHGEVELIAYDGNGTFNYRYTLGEAIDHADGNGTNTADDADSFTVTITDDGGLSDTATVNIDVVDDVPEAEDDGPAVVTEDGTSVVDGNVLDNDNAYADQPAAFVGWSADGFDNTAAVNDLNTYGTLVQNADGSWSYTLNNSLAETQALDSDDALSYDLYYTMADADGDESVAKLTITINGADDKATVDAGGGETVYEAGLPEGSANDDSDLVIGGTLSVSASDGIASVTIGGVLFTFAEVQAFDGSDTVNTGQGIITLQSYSGNASSGTITYDYALSATIDNDSVTPAAPETVDGNSYLDVVAIAVDGVGGSNAVDNLEISIVDDVPEAKDDGVINVAEDTATTFSVFGNDEFGADDVDTDNDPSTVVSHSGAGNGTVSYNAGTGQFTYTPDAGYAGSDSFTYTIKDGDGDTSTATVSLLVAADSTPQIGQTENLIVDEDGFDYAADDAETSRDDETDSTESLTDSGTVTVDFGNDVPVNLLSSIVLVDEIDLDSQLTSDDEPVIFALESGVLVGRADGTEVIRIEITNAVPGSNAGEVDYTYQVTLSQPVEHADGALENSELLSGVKFTVTDSDNSTADGTFDVTIVDDVPDIAPISFGSIEDGQSFNDISLESLFGADGPGDIAFASSLDGADVMQGEEQVLFDGEPLTWSLSDDVLTAKTPSGVDAITLTLNDADGNYDISVAEGTFYLEGGVQTFAIADLSGSNALAWVGQSDGIDTLIISEGTSTNTSNAGNTGYVGAGSQWIDAGTSDSTTFYFYDDIDAPTGSLSDQAELDAALASSLVAGVNSFSISVNIQGNNTTTIQLAFTAVDGTLGSASVEIEPSNPSNPDIIEIESSDITWEDGKSGLAIASVEFQSGDVDYRVGGDLVYTEITPADIELDLPVTISDSDGDTSDGNITGTITSEGVASPLTLSEIPDELYVGTNDPNTKVTEGGNDVLIGDLGGRELQFNPGKDYSIALIADESGSMAGDRTQLLKEALESFVNDLADHDGVINIALIGFDPGANIEISVADLTTENGLDDLLAEIDNLAASGGTNYEAAFEKAVEWFQGQPDGHEFISYFMTDGDPTLYNGGGDGNDTDFETFQAAVEAFEALSAISEVNGIGIGSGVNEEYLRFFDNTNIDGSATESFASSNVTRLADFNNNNDPLDSGWIGSGDNDGSLSYGGNGNSSYLRIRDERNGGSFSATSPSFTIMVGGAAIEFEYRTDEDHQNDDFSWRLEKQDDDDNWQEVRDGELSRDNDYDDVTISNLDAGTYRLVYTVEDSGNGNDDAELRVREIELREPSVNDVTGPIGQPQIINSAGELIAELQAGNTTNTPEQLGDDVLEGSDGDDVLFGDTIYTDDLTWTNGEGEEIEAGHGLGYEGLMEYLTWAENGGTAPDDAQIMQYIRDNYESLVNPNPTLAEIDAAGDDTLIGGAGNDILSGGSGADIFIWNNGDEGTPGTPAHDVIIDFSANEGDSLDLADMLQGEENGVLTDYLNVQETGNDVVISVSPEGTDITQVITLTDTTLSDMGAGGLSDQADIINKLVVDGTLHVDPS